jgi:DNA-binding NarL/FixJ family response regulator
VVRVLLVDGDPRVREGLRVQLQLEPGVSIVGEADTATDALAFAQEMCPDVVIIDVDQPDMDGIALTREFNRLSPCSRIIILSIYDDAARRSVALAAGAHAFVGKGSVEFFRNAFHEMVRTHVGKQQGTQPPAHD